MAETDADMDLQALAAIQTIEAAPVVAQFRTEWLDRQALPDRAAAYEWIQEHGTPASREVLFAFDPEGERPQSAQGKAAAEWVRRRADSARLSRVRYREPWLRVEVRDDAGRLRDTLDLAADPGTPIGELYKVAQLLAARYRWELQDAVMFVLTDAAPIQSVIDTSATQEMRIGSPIDSTPASAPMTQEIVIHCRPQATQKQVAQAYERARRDALEAWGIPTGERNRATTSQRTRDLAIHAARIRAGEFADTREAFNDYLARHPGEELTYPDDNVGRFRRDIRAAWERITGHDLNFSEVFDQARHKEA